MPLNQSDKVNMSHNLFLKPGRSSELYNFEHEVQNTVKIYKLLVSRRKHIILQSEAYLPSLPMSLEITTHTISQDSVLPTHLPAAKF